MLMSGLCLTLYIDRCLENKFSVKITCEESNISPCGKLTKTQIMLTDGMSSVSIAQYEVLDIFNCDGRIDR